MNSTRTTRREFLGKSIVTGAGIAAGLRAATFGGVAKAAYDSTTITATVGITKGADRADNAFRAMQLFKNQIAAAIGNRRVVIKPNFVWYSNTYACTRMEHVDGILEFLKSIGKRDVVVAESSAQGPIANGYDAFGYWGLTRKYPVKLMDLNQEGFTNADIWQYGSSSNTTKTTIRVSKLYLNPNNFIISATPMKTHNTVVVTLASKNIAMSAPVIDIGSSQGQGGAIGSNKSNMHGAGGSSGSDYQCLNDNVFRLMCVYGIRPHLAVIDGYQGMEGDGPVSGSGISNPQQLAVASLDWLAADRVALELMGSNNYVVLNHTQDGYNMPFPACLNYLWQVGLGEWDLRKIRVIGEQIAPNVVNYTASPSKSNQISGIRTTPREGTIVNPIT